MPPDSTPPARSGTGCTIYSACTPRECAEAEESPDERDAAVIRVLGSWLWLVNQSALRAPSGVLRLARDTAAEIPVDPVVASELLAAAGAWFEAEQAGLVTAVERAAAMDLDGIACELAAALVASPVAVRNQFDEWWRTHDAGLAAARRAGNRRGEAMLLAGLGQLQVRAGPVQRRPPLPARRARRVSRGEGRPRRGDGTGHAEYGQP